MKTFIATLVLVGIVAGIGQAWAVKAASGDTGIPSLDEAGDKIYDSAKNRWVPKIVFFGLVALAVIIVIGVARVVGATMRVVMACGVLAIACGGTIGSLYPGLITGLVL